MRLLAPVATFVFAFGLQALDVRKSPADYPVQGSAKDFELGAEYMVRSFLADEHSFTMDDYLLVELGIFPSGEAAVRLDRLQLRINGKNVLHAQTPGMAAASVKYPDWTRKPTLEAGLGTPDGGGIILGRRQPKARFPGDPRERPQTQGNAERLGTEEKQVDYTYVINRAALPEGPTKRPVAGFVFFAYDGKLKSIRTVELLVDGVPVKLR